MGNLAEANLIQQYLAFEGYTAPIIVDTNAPMQWQGKMSYVGVIAHFDRGDISLYGFYQVVEFITNNGLRRC